MSRMAGTGNASKPSTAARMENRYFEMDETILSMESAEERRDAERLRAKQGKLADAYFFKFIRPKLNRFQQAVSAA